MGLGGRGAPGALARFREQLRRQGARSIRAPPVPTPSANTTASTTASTSVSTSTSSDDSGGRAGGGEEYEEGDEEGLIAAAAERLLAPTAFALRVGAAAVAVTVAYNDPLTVRYTFRPLFDRCVSL